MVNTGWIASLVWGLCATALVHGDPPWLNELEKASPTAANPLHLPKADRVGRERWAKLIEDYSSLPVDQVRANPTASAFPGAVKGDAPRAKNSRFEIDLNRSRWQFTGLYAPPGEKISITVPQGLPAGTKVRIGCHTDDLFETENWSRFPILSREVDLSPGKVEIANPFGGLVYFDIPRDEARGGRYLPTHGGDVWLDEKSPPLSRGVKEVIIDGGVQAPCYRLGKTTPEAWRAQLRETAAPWGELEGLHMSFALPTEVLGEVADPAGVLRFWDRVLEEARNFSGFPGASGSSLEHFVPDVQPAAGFLHSGYPIVGQYFHAREMVDLKTLQLEGNWGLFHEIGHNHQSDVYTFDRFVEVTVNLHTLYLMKTICGREPAEARLGWDVTAQLKEAIGGKADVFARLALYVPLIEEFGFESFTRTFRTYWVADGMPDLSDNQEKIDEFVRRYSLAVGYDCSLYLSRVGLACGPKTSALLAKLPKFMPPGLN